MLGTAPGYAVPVPTVPAMTSHPRLDVDPCPINCRRPCST